MTLSYLTFLTERNDEQCLIKNIYMLKRLQNLLTSFL
jgi:hypothetical protein